MGPWQAVAWRRRNDYALAAQIARVLQPAVCLFASLRR